jgi:hypothetical protein
MFCECLDETFTFILRSTPNTSDAHVLEEDCEQLAFVTCPFGNELRCNVLPDGDCQASKMHIMAERIGSFIDSGCPSSVTLFLEETKPGFTLSSVEVSLLETHYGWFLGGQDWKKLKSMSGPIDIY